MKENLPLSPNLEKMCSEEPAKSGTDCSSIQTSNFTLHYIVRENDLNSVNDHIKQFGVKEINILNESGWSPLHIAVSRNNPGIVQTLIEHGADVNILTRNGNSPVQIAIKVQVNDKKKQQDNILLIKHLVTNGTCINCQHLVENGSCTNCQNLVDKSGYSNCQHRHWREIQKLAEEWNRYDLFPILCLEREEGLPEETKRKLQHCIKTDAVSANLKQESDFEGLVANHFKDLIQSVVKVERNYQKLFHIYVKKGELDILKGLLQVEDVDINGPNSDGLTPLQYSIQDGKWKTVEFLLNNGSSVDNYTKGYHPIAVAILMNKWDVAKSLLDHVHDLKSLHEEGMLDIALRSSKLSEEERPGYEANVNFLRHLVEDLFTAIEECDNFDSCSQKYLTQRTNQYMSRIHTRTNHLYSQYFKVMTIFLKRDYTNAFRKIYFNISQEDQNSFSMSIFQTLAPGDETISFVKALVLEAVHHESQSRKFAIEEILIEPVKSEIESEDKYLKTIYGDRINYLRSGSIISKENIQKLEDGGLENSTDLSGWKKINMVQEIQGQAIRIMKQTYGDNKDSILTLLASTGRCTALSYMLTRNPAKAHVAKNDLYELENCHGQNLLEVIQSQGTKLIRQREELLDLIAEKHEHKKIILDKLKNLTPTSREGKDTLVSLISRFDRTPQEKIKIIITGIIPFLLTSSLWIADISTDIQVTLESAACIYHKEENLNSSFNNTSLNCSVNSLNCSRFESSEWLTLTSLSGMSIALPFLFFTLLEISMTSDLYEQKNILPNPLFGRLLNLIGLILAPITSRLMRAMNFIQFNLATSGPDRISLRKQLLRSSKKMVVIAVTEISLEANYQLYINFVLFFPNILRVLLDILNSGKIYFNFGIESRRLAIMSSFITLVWVNSAFKVHTKQGALDFTVSPLARLLLILTHTTEILGRLVIIANLSYVSYSESEPEVGSVNWQRALIFFIVHVSLCFIINLVINDNYIKNHWNHPMFYLEALINGFNSLFTYSDYVMYNIEERIENHQPSFLRQALFQAIFFIEFMWAILNGATSSVKKIKDEHGNIIDIYERKFGLTTGICVIYILGITLRILYYRVHPWMINLNPSWTLRVLGEQVNLKPEDQEEAPYLKTKLRSNVRQPRTTINERMWHQYVQSVVVNKKLTHAAIIGQRDKTIWAKSVNFEITPEEVSTLLESMDDLTTMLKTTISIAGVKYVTQGMFDNVLTLSQIYSASNLHLAKTGKTLLIGVSDEQLTMQQASIIMQTLAVSLSNKGF